MEDTYRQETAADSDIRVGHSGDAIYLLDEMLERADVLLDAGGQVFYVPRMEALKDAITRGIL